MRCSYCCTVSAYDIKAIHRALGGRHSTESYRDVVHLPLSGANIFIFNYGSLVMWNLAKEDEKEVFDLLRAYEIKPLENFEFEELEYHISEKNKITNDELSLTDTDPLTLLAVSHGLAQSVKLGTFEERIQKTYNSTKHIPEELSTLGKISLSRKQIRKMMGFLFIERNSINLHFEVLDTPEFFWEYSELEPLYKMISKEMDIETRVEVLNQRLDVIHELFEMLSNELNHQHSSRLEWIIIILIVIEVLLILEQDFFKWF